ncbi:MAG TPA: N-acetylmuramic acid 6-phosphate etherase [Phycisphaerales bacterium]|nr:N-acetylmuramic acid 6-phosphate etherase [Phycisphaerales bacterium]
MAERLPPDRSHLSTEQRHAGARGLHTLSIRGCIELMNKEDRTVAEAVRSASSAISDFIADVEPGFCRGGRLVYVGAGTSGRLGVLDASEAPPTFDVSPGRVVGLIAGGDSALRRSSEGAEDDSDGAREALTGLGLTDDDAVLGIAAGGTTPYVRGALGIARELAANCTTGLLSCVSTNKPPGCTHLIAIETGPEILSGSTRLKAGTATKMVLNTISTTLMIRSGRVYDNLMVDLRATNDKLTDRAIRIVMELTDLDRAGAFGLLERAGRRVKVALVMHRLGLGPEEAQARLERVDHRLWLLLDPPTGGAGAR